jgi:hypothetical protein
MRNHAAGETLKFSLSALQQQNTYKYCLMAFKTKPLSAFWRSNSLKMQTRPVLKRVVMLRYSDGPDHTPVWF